MLLDETHLQSSFDQEESPINEGLQSFELLSWSCVANLEEFTGCLYRCKATVGHNNSVRVSPRINHVKKVTGASVESRSIAIVESFCLIGSLGLDQLENWHMIPDWAQQAVWISQPSSACNQRHRWQEHHGWSNVLLGHTILKRIHERTQWMKIWAQISFRDDVMFLKCPLFSVALFLCIIGREGWHRREAEW